MGAIITLLTDFGVSDSYVAAMKGVILSINREATLIDICHNIPPQNVAQAAFVLGTAYQYFPRQTIHLAVVDPGVGTERRAIILRTPSAYFVAPDNGVLSYIIQQSSASTPSHYVNLTQVVLESDMEAIAMTKPEFWQPSVSATFHGRDIFAPVAARLSLGLAPEVFGEKVTSLAMLPLPYPHRAPDGTLVAHILHIDSFGNLITDVRSKDLPPKNQKIAIEVGNQSILGLSRTYANGKGLLALIGSSGYLEISLNGGNAHSFLNTEIGEEVRIRQLSGGAQ